MAESRWILHLDLDQFIAAVEIRRRPELRGLPVVVGGDGDPTRRRQVVATASYEARAFGVRSGMPLSTALRRCPDAVFLPSDRAAYDAASAEVWDVVRQQPLLVEVWGWDEGFLGTDVDDPIAARARTAWSGRRHHRLHLLHRRGRQQDPCQARHRVRQSAPGCAARRRAGGLPAHGRHVVGADGATTARGVVGHRETDR